MTRRLAISYSRFSSPLQAKGDSETRQEDLFKKFCARHNLTPVKEVFADRGRSGYHDEHRKRGRLGQLIAAAKDGRFEPGTIIVVEAWDRLGRLRPDRQTELVAELLRTGICFGVCRLDDIFTEEDFGTHKWTTLAIFIQLAYQESKQKAERVGASWQRRREKARAGNALLTTRLPAWLECVKGEVRLIPERAAAVRRIFQLAADGCGLKRIVTTLTNEKVPAFGEVIVREGRGRSQFSGNWGRAYVGNILRDRRAIGELQPHKDGQPDGDPLVNYYPACVSEEQFLLARAGQAERAVKDGKRNWARQSKYVNVFRNLLTHARDGEGFMLHNKGPGNNPQLLLINTTGNEGRSNCYTFPYLIFEDVILSRLREISADDILPREADTISRLDSLRAKLGNVRQQIQQLSADLKADGYSKALAAMLREQEKEEEALANDLQEELARSARPAARGWADLPTLADAVKSADDPDAVRLKLRTVLRQATAETLVLIVHRRSWQFVVVQIHFVGGARRDYLIARQVASCHCRGGVWVKSAAEVPALSKLDLRKRSDIKRVEKFLEALDLTAARASK